MDPYSSSTWNVRDPAAAAPGVGPIAREVPIARNVASGPTATAMPAAISSPVVGEERSAARGEVAERLGLAERPRRGLRLSLGAKLYAGFLCVAFAGLAVGGVLVDRNVRTAAAAQVEDRLSYEATMLGQMTASALFGDIDPTDASLNESVRALARAVHTHLSIVANNGAVVADSESDAPLTLPSQLAEPEIDAARTHETGTSMRAGRMFVAHAIRSEGKLLGFARGSVALDAIGAHVRAVRVRMAYGALIAALVAIVLGYLITSRIVRPLRALFAGARRVGRGDFSQPISITTNDEIAELSTAFNEMTLSLRETMAKLDRRHRDMRLVLDNVSQGLIAIDAAGAIAPERSAVTDEWFGAAAPAQRFWDYLSRIDARTGAMFLCAWNELWTGEMPFEVALAQLPEKMSAGEREYELDYTPLAGDGVDRELSGMLVVISDVTARVAAERAESEQREIVGAFERIMKDKAGYVDFLTEAQELVDRLGGDVRPPLSTAKFTLHTLKGNASVFGLTKFASLCHRLEDRMAASGADLSRQDRDDLTQAWGQFAKRLETLLGDRPHVEIDIDGDDYDRVLRAVVAGLPNREIARALSDWRLEKVEKRLQRLAGQARWVGLQLGKPDIAVAIETDGLRLSRARLGAFWTAMTHVVRNAVDHGIEARDEREQVGKPPVGQLVMRAMRSAQGDHVIIEVSDDGRGIDWDAVRRRASEARLPHGSPADLVDALFHEGVSTKAHVSDVSGRGLGLAAARVECQKLGGTMTVESERARGTTFRFAFPRETVGGVAPSVPILVAAAKG